MTAAITIMVMVIFGFMHTGPWPYVAALGMYLLAQIAFADVRAGRGDE